MAKQLSLTNTAARGIAWNTLGGIFAKSFSFFSQLILGWILSQSDFGIYALAAASSVLILALKYGGTEQILIQKGSQFNQYKSTVLTVSVLFNTIGAGALYLLAPQIAVLYETPELVSVINVIALSLFLSTPLVIFRSKVSIDLKFGDIAKIDTMSAFIRHTSMVLFALSGYGPLSFVLPILLTTVFEVVAFWWVARKSHVLDLNAVTWDKIKNILLDARWMIISAVSIGLATQGDYMAAAFFITKAELGIYFFGFQLVVSIVGLFDSSIRAVMLPSLTALSNNLARLSLAYLKSLRILSLITAPLAIFVFFSTPVLIHLLWDGKWDDAIVVVQAFALCIPAWCFMSLSLTLLSARGLWRVRMYFSVTDAITLIIAAILGAMLGEVYYIALCVSIQRVMMAIIITFYTSSLLNIKTKGLGKDVGRTVIGIYLLAGLVYFLFSYIVPINYFFNRSFLEVICFSTLMILLSFTFFNRDYREILGLVKGMMSRT